MSLGVNLKPIETGPRTRHGGFFWASVIAFAIFVGLVLASCGRRKGGHKPPPPPPPPPPNETRATPAELSARMRFAADNVGIPPSYANTQNAAALARGAQPTAAMVPRDAGYWDIAIPLLCFLRGDAAAQEASRQYFRKWLHCELGVDCIPPGGKGWRHSSVMCSLNHQENRQFGILAATIVLGPQEAARYGDPSKVAKAKERMLDVLTGAAWYGTGSNERVVGGPCGGGSSAGDHPEGWRSRHYANRFWQITWALADLVPDAQIAEAAARELDKAVAHLRPGVRADGLWDEGILPNFRADTGSRCPCQDGDPGCPAACTKLLKSKGLTCLPGETQVISYILFAGKEWRPEFSGAGSGECSKRSRDEQWGDYFRFGGTRWRPLK